MTLATRLHTALGALTQRDFRLFYVALLGTSMGYQLQRTIELWLVYQLTEPLLRPFRKVIPPIGGIDLSPLFALIAIQFLMRLLG